jgi:ubiquinone/menaquinone biosynthesis C-methylase UbiE
MGYGQSAKYYDLIYTTMGKDYAGEAQKIHKIAGKFGKSKGKDLLDAACGTGLHAGYLTKYYQVVGLDIDEGMLEAAREKHPEIIFHKGDMRDFNLGKEFDVVTCLFSAIGYMKNIDELRQAVGAMGRHLKPWGVLLVEPWFTPEAWKAGSVHASYVDQPEVKIARMNVSGVKGNISFFDFHFLIGTNEGIEHFTEYHELTLFTQKQMLEAFRENGLKVTHDEKGIYGRGMYIGVKEA